MVRLEIFWYKNLKLYDHFCYSVAGLLMSVFGIVDFFKGKLNTIIELFKGIL